MVRRTVLVGCVQILDVRVVARVLKQDRLDRVDVPDRCAFDHRQCISISEDVVEGTDLTTEEVGLGKIEVIAKVGVTRLVEHLHRIFLGVGVEVTQQEHGELAVLHPRGESLGLCHAVRVGVALVGAIIDARALGLEVVDDRRERVLDGVVLSGFNVEDLPVLCKRIARVVERSVIKNPGLSHRLYCGRLVDVGRANDVVACRHGGRGRNECPRASARIRVQRGHQVGKCIVAILGGINRRVRFDLFQRDNVRAQLVDRRNDLDLLTLKRRRRVGTTHGAAVRRRRVAFPVAVERTSGLVLTEVVEVVQHVERSELHLPADLFRGRGAGVGKRHGLGGAVVAVNRLRRLIVPRVEAVVQQDSRVLERNRGADAGVATHLDVRNGLVGLTREVRRLAVIQRDGQRVLQRVLLGPLVGVRDGVVQLTRVDDRGGAVGELQRTVVGEVRVVIGDHVVALRSHEHRLIGFTNIGVVREGERDRFKRLTRGLFHEGWVRQLGQLVVLPCRTGQRDTVTDRDVQTLGTGVNEDAIGRVTCGASLGLGVLIHEVEAVETASEVRSRHHTRGLYDLAIQRSHRTGALNLGDLHFRDLGVDRRVRRIDRRVRRVNRWIGGVNRIAPRHGAGGHVGGKGEVSGVIVGIRRIRARNRAGGGIRAGVGRGRCFEGVGSSIADEINDVLIDDHGSGGHVNPLGAFGKNDDAIGATQIQRAGQIDRSFFAVGGI